uniref:DnaJ homolog subfamily C member 16 n=1 Tax=Catharus ustulatus TaxID=91951 RepID=A0A8C3U9I0_CATUS
MEPARSCLLLLLLLPALAAAAPGEFDPYRVLGVGRSSSQADIKKAYKRLAREWHPDKNKDPGAEDKFIQISKAYEILSNEEKRANFDRYGDSFFHFPFNAERRDTFDEKYLLHFSHYINEIVPDSFKKPYLIKVTSDWCFSCIPIEPVWKEVAQELEALGGGIGVVHTGYERRLAHHMGAHSAPTLLGLINGKITFFHNAVVRENLRQFVENLLPGNLVEKVGSSRSVRCCCSSLKDNKPHVLLFDHMPVVPLLYKLTAFAYRDYLSFGYVYVGLRGTEELSSQYNINVYTPTMMIFKEHIDRPADVVPREMNKQLIDDFLSQNKFLMVTRLTSQRLFQELCPVKKSHRQRNDRQPEFADALLMDEEKYHGRSAVVILERRNNAGKIAYKALEEAWQGSKEDNFILLDLLDQLRTDPGLLSSETVVADLNDELAPMFLIRWFYSTLDYISDCWDSLFHSNWREMMPLLSLLFSALFILFGTVIVQAFSDSSDTRDAPPSGKEETATKTEKNDASFNKERFPKRALFEVTEPGHMNVVLILSNSTKTPLLQKFALEVYTFTGSSSLHFSFLSLDKHREWLEYLLEFAQDAAPIPNQYDKHFLERDYTGYVLALNGHKKYFCLFKPHRSGDEGGTLGSCKDYDASQHAEARGKSSCSPGSRSIKNKLHKLSFWMERLLEGRERAWP